MPFIFHYDVRMLPVQHEVCVFWTSAKLYAIITQPSAPTRGIGSAWIRCRWIAVESESIQDCLDKFGSVQVKKTQKGKKDAKVKKKKVSKEKR